MGEAAMTRRGFVGGVAAGVGLALSRSPARGQGAPARRALPNTVRLGGPSFSKAEDPAELARAHRKLGYRAAYCPAIKLADRERIRDTEEAFAREDVVIAEVGRWVNLLDADAAKREANLKTVTEGLALAEEVGARCCVDIAGSFNEVVWYGPHPKNLSADFFDAAVENARKIIDAVKPKRAKFCYEMMGWCLPDSVESYLKMMAAVDREGFGVHLDPCNLINSPQRFYENAKLINECFDKLGPHIVSCHAKDLAWEVEMNVHFKEVVAGKGSLDYATYLKRLTTTDPEIPLMMEHLKDATEYAASRDHIMGVGKRVGVGFE